MPALVRLGYTFSAIGIFLPKLFSFSLPLFVLLAISLGLDFLFSWLLIGTQRFGMFHTRVQCKCLVFLFLLNQLKSFFQFTHQISIGKGRLFRWFQVVLLIETPASILIFLVFLLLRFNLPEKIGLIFPCSCTRPSLKIQFRWFLCETEGILSGANLMLLKIHE